MEFLKGQFLEYLHAVHEFDQRLYCDSGRWRVIAIKLHPELWWELRRMAPPYIDIIGSPVTQQGRACFRIYDYSFESDPGVARGCFELFGEENKLLGHITVREYEFHCVMTALIGLRPLAPLLIADYNPDDAPADHVMLAEPIKEATVWDILTEAGKAERARGERFQRRIETRRRSAFL